MFGLASEDIYEPTGVISINLLMDECAFWSFAI